MSFLKISILYNHLDFLFSYCCNNDVLYPWTSQNIVSSRLCCNAGTTVSCMMRYLDIWTKRLRLSLVKRDNKANSFTKFKSSALKRPRNDSKKRYQSDLTIAGITTNALTVFCPEKVPFFTLQFHVSHTG